MKTITIASAKGGSGKSTITAVLAVRVHHAGNKVAMMDLNFDQASLSQWWTMRGEPDSPRLVSNIEDIPRDVKLLSFKFDWLLIDTPPGDMDLIEQAIAVANAVIIPVRPSFFDVMAVNTVIEMCREHRKPFACLLSAVDSRFKALTVQTKTALADLGAPILATPVSYRQHYISALTSGRTGAEIEKALQPEIDALWKEIKTLLDTGRFNG